MGDQAATSYEVIGKLADGDVAELFLAKAAGAGEGTSERLVVIKRIPRKATQNTALVKSFLEEAHIAARLQHPNIAQVYEVGKLGGSYFFAMEYVNGETLRALVEHAKTKKIQVPIRSIVTIAAGAVAALHHAHDRGGVDGTPLGIVHADVSPTNLLVSREGIVKLLDFGIAKTQGRSNVPAAPDKVSYWSPEQCRGGALDRRSDLFSLGVVLWELVTLEDLFHRGGDAKTRAAIENEDAPAASARRYDVPPELDVILQRMIAKNVDDRFKDAEEVAVALEGLASKLGFQLSTAELARMMRLWFGNVPDPVIGASEKPLVVKSEPIPQDLTVAPAADPIDGLLDTVRNASEMIRAAAVLGATPKAGGVIPKVGDTVEATREDFAQVRDRILAQARKKKETRPPAVTPPTAAEAAAASAGGRPKRETLNSSNNAYSFITNVSGKTNEPIRKMGITSTPPMGTAMAAAAAEGASAESATGEDASEASSPRASIGKRTATYEAVSDVSINDAIALTSSAMAKAGSEADAAKTDAAKTDATDAAQTDATDAAQTGATDAAQTGATDAAKTDAATNAAQTGATDAAKTDATDAAKIDAAKADSTDVAKSDAAKADSTDAAKSDAAKADATDAAKADATEAAKADAAKIDSKTDDAAKTDGKSDAKADAAKTAAAAQSGDKSNTDDSSSSKAKDAAREAPRASQSRAVRADTPRSSVAREVDEDDTPAPRPGWMIPAALAAGALVVIVILFKVRGSSDKPAPNASKTQAHVALADARVTEPVQTPDAPQLAMQTPDAAEVAAVPVDAQEVAVAPPIDAAVQVASVTPDAAVDKPKDPIKPKDPVDKPKDPKDPKAKDPKKEPEGTKSIEELVAAGDFVKANKECKSNTIFNSVRLTACTLAACNAKDANLAKRWIRAIQKSARADLIKTCTDLGVVVEDPAAPAPAPAAEPAP